MQRACYLSLLEPVVGMPSIRSSIRMLRVESRLNDSKQHLDLQAASCVLILNRLETAGSMTKSTTWVGALQIGHGA